MSAFMPSDQAERDAIRTLIDENMCVEAGAGTGKTTVLVGRIVETLRRGRARVHEMAVITFTEKAAAELAGRVREELERARTDEATTTDERARLEAALRDLSRAHIETIHAFAASLLRERPIEAGVDPGFGVLTDLPAQLDFEAAYEDWMTEEMAKQPPPGALLDALNLGVPYTSVREAAEALHRHRDVLPLAPPAAQADPVPAFLAVFDDVCARMPRLRERCKTEQDGAYQQIAEALHLATVLRELRGDALRRAIVTTRPPAKNRGNQANWVTAQDCRNAKAAIDEYRTALTECIQSLRQGATAALLHWLQDFVVRYARKRKEAGTADFDDLLSWARDLVRSNPEVRRYFGAQYRCIFVDEFQDTDPLQAELILRLCDASDATDWRDAKPRPGSLFVVGDPKQSIYRFRRADIGMYDTVKARVFGGRVRHIVQNFRSARPIITWVNAIFARLIESEPNVQPEYVDLVHHPALAAASDECVNIVPCVVPGKIADVRRAESAAIASLIATSVRDGAWLVRGDEDEPRRTATWRDVAVLIPSRAELHVFEEALALAGVPYRHEGGRTFFQRQEVRELIAVLRAIDDPADQVAAVAALRSSAFGVSDEELLLYGASFNGLRVRRDAAGPVADALRVLGELRALRHDHALPDIVRTVLDRTRLVEFAMLQPQGEQVAANLLKLIDQARSFSSVSGGGLRGFVRWLKENQARTPDETDALISEETDDVVRVVTVHASKGLEFPVVVFANMETEWSNRTRVIPDRNGGRLHLRLDKSELGFTTPGWDDAIVAERHHDFAEQARVLYVAATRARDRLIVPVFSNSANVHAREEAKSATELLRIVGVDAPDGAAIIDPATLPSFPGELPVWRRPLAAATVAAVDRVVAARDEWDAEHRAVLTAAKRPLTVRTASALKPEWEREDMVDGVRRGRATEFGSAVHALLERIDLGRPEDATAMAPSIAAEFGLPGREGEIAEVAERALASDVIARARRSQRVLREVAFTAALPGATEGLAEGRMDLLFVEDGGIVIVDFKTDSVSASQAAERAAHYRPQALVYAWAAHRATGTPVREVVFLFARPGIEHAETVDAPFLAEAEALLAQPVAAGTEETLASTA